MKESVKAAKLPSSSELLRRYDRFSRLYFDNKLPPASEVTVEWSTRLISSAGLCRPRERLIRLSVPYHVKFPNEVDSTLLHEMIHLLVPNHGPEFVAWMAHIRRLGGDIKRYSLERATPVKYRWRYTCVGCGISRRNVRRYPLGGKNYRCRRCGGSLREEMLVD